MKTSSFIGCISILTATLLGAGNPANAVGTPSGPSSRGPAAVPESFDIFTDELAVFRRKRVFGGLSAFAEGCSAYKPRLAVEADWYRDDPKGRLGPTSRQG
ncbi:MAG TPA: hypothetical protein VGL34_27655 [Steroidobacteraceae bacterium]